MLESYFLKCRERTLGVISYDVDRDLYSFEPMNKIENARYYPANFYGLWALGTLDLSREVGDFEVRNFLEDRIVPKERQNLRVILDHFGLTCWDLWELSKGYRIINKMDYFWITKDENEDWRTVLTRV